MKTIRQSIVTSSIAAIALSGSTSADSVRVGAQAQALEHQQEQLSHVPLQQQQEPEQPNHGAQRELELTKGLQENMSDVWEPFDPSRHTPFFWQIPKAGSTNALAYFTICMDLVEASRVGLTSRTDHLEVIDFEGHNFVNVDVSTPIGIKHAHNLGLPESGMADVVSSAYAFHIFDDLFDAQHQGKMFALFRHPIERLVSKFYYLQTAKHERTYNPKFQHMTIEEYARIPMYVGDNWMTRMLTNKIEAPLVPEDLDIAKEIIRKKCLVGLTTHMDESLDRFEKYFGWQLKDTYRGERHQTGEECKASFYHPETAELGTKFNTHSHPKIERDSEAWDLLAQVSLYDLELYWYAVETFMEQEQIFAQY